jgi:hypothetical protein
MASVPIVCNEYFVNDNLSGRRYSVRREADILQRHYVDNRKSSNCGAHFGDESTVNL